MQVESSTSGSRCVWLFDDTTLLFLLLLLICLECLSFHTISLQALGWEQREDKNFVTGTGQEWWYHWKADELKRTNPSALVPTLVPVDPETGKSDESKVRSFAGTHTGR